MNTELGRHGGDYNLSNPVKSFVDVVSRVVVRPTSFFAELPWRRNFVSPLIFALICVETSTILGWLLVMVGVVQNPAVGADSPNLVVPSVPLPLFEPDAPVVWGLVSISLTPIVAAVSVFVTAGIQQLLVRLIVGTRNFGFGASFRVASYTQVTSLLGWIPYIGPLLAPLYGLYLAIVGIREMHETTTGKATLIILIPVALVLLIPVGVFLAAWLRLLAVGQVL